MSGDRAPASTGPGYHPYDQEQARHPHAALAAVRRERPALRCRADGYPETVLLTRYADLSHVFRDSLTFGNMGTKTSIAAHDAALADCPGVGELDGRRHAEVRRLLLVALAPRALDDADPHIARASRQVVAAFAGDGRADLVRQWATPIPSDAIAFVLGLPESDWPMIHTWVAAQFTDAQVDARTTTGGIGAPPQDFLAYVRAQIVQRRRSPDRYDDALSRMVAFERDGGGGYDVDELTHHVRTLLTAGNETTTSLMANLVHRLLTTPGALEAVRREPSLVAPVVEESLRIDAPVQVFNRRVRRPVVIAGEQLAVDDIAVLSIASGNRDEGAWGDDADEFRVDRFAEPGQVPRHLGFGLGPHFCVGAALARMSARHGLAALLEAVTALELEPGWSYDKVPYHAVLRPRSLPVRFRPVADGDA